MYHAPAAIFTLLLAVAALALIRNLGRDLAANADYAPAQGIILALAAVSPFWFAVGVLVFT